MKQPAKGYEKARRMPGKEIALQTGDIQPEIRALHPVGEKLELSRFGFMSRVDA